MVNSENTGKKNSIGCRTLLTELSVLYWIIMRIFLVIEVKGESVFTIQFRHTEPPS